MTSPPPGTSPASTLLPSVRGELLTQLGRTEEASSELARAAHRCSNARERAVLERKLLRARLIRRHLVHTGLVLRATDDHRRARLARRQGLHPAHRHDRVEAATAAMTALHATEPTTPHLSLLSRVGELSVGDVEAALYEERSIVKTMAMRRTLFVVTRDVLPAVVGSAGQRVADLERRRLAREADELDGEAEWIASACREIVACLTGRELSVRQLRDALPHLAGTFTAGAGTRWSAEVPTMSRLLTILAAAGEVVRGGNGGHWRISRPLWTAMASWLGEPLVPAATESGYADIVRRWLWTFGPGTEADLVWWLGATKTAVRAAIGQLGALHVELDDGTSGWVLPDDTADLEARPQAEPWVALLPTLDPTTMGWKQRDFYLDPGHRPYLFDSVGNAGTTVWVNGRVVGCWVQDAGGRVRLVLLADVARNARRMLDVEVARLEEFLGGDRITNVYASQQMRSQHRLTPDGLASRKCDGGTDMRKWTLGAPAHRSGTRG